MTSGVTKSLPSVREKISVRTEGNENFDPDQKYQIKHKFDDLKGYGEYPLNRVLDIVIGSFGVIVFFALFPVFAFLIKASSKGPVLFKQKRTGKLGNEFLCYKFRTMHLVELKSENGKPIVTKKGDKRIFWFGKFLRKTNLDELPQILNVFKGEMSLVGPRPYPVEECRHWNNTFEDFYYRYLVKPGITGLAQTTGFRGGTLDEKHMRRRLDKDLIYVQKQSLKIDITILFNTLKQMILFKTNAH